MKCFLPCFSPARRKKSFHLVNGTTLQIKKKPKPFEAEVPKILTLVPKENTKEKVTFDVLLKTEEESPTNNLVNEKVGEETEISIDIKTVPKSNYRYENRVDFEQQTDFEGNELSDQSDKRIVEEEELSDSLFSLSIESRKQLGCDVELGKNEELSDSLFSLSIESRKRLSCDVEIGENEISSAKPNEKLIEFSPIDGFVGGDQVGNLIQSDGKSVELKKSQLLRYQEDVKKGFSLTGEVENSQLFRGQVNVEKDPFFTQPNKEVQNIDHVLNSIENLTQWKEKSVMAKQGSFPEYQENANIEGESFQKVMKEISEEQEMGVDTSLSSWLLDSQGKKRSSTSSSYESLPKSYEDRPILGALTNKDLKEFSPRRVRRSQSPNKIPIVGTLGSYWNCTAQFIDSDSSQDKENRSKTSSFEESPKSYEDRPILGALTNKDLKPRWIRRSQSPNKTPIVDTVGSYWSCTTQFIDTDFSQENENRSKTNRQGEGPTLKSATPFTERLERSVDQGLRQV